MRKALMMFGAAVFVVFLISVVALKTKRNGSMLPQVYAQDEEGCSLATLHGRYGFSADGWLLSPFAPFAEAGVSSSDGNGNSAGSYTMNSGGSTTTLNFSGTYTVARDCTGSTTVTSSDGSVHHLTFVIVDHGKQARAVGTDSGAVYTLASIRQ
jgi:hypothetical protein